MSIQKNYLFRRTDRKFSCFQSVFYIPKYFQDINFYFSDLELGDVNIDGEIDALDAILVLEIILDDLGYNQNADINEDMNIDLLDIIIIINIIIT